MKTMIKNTKEKGFVEFIVFPEKDNFVGVCLQFNIIEEGPDREKIFKSLIEAAVGHLNVVRKENLSDELLNRPAPKKYWTKLEQLKFQTEIKKVMRNNNPLIPLRHTYAYCY